MQQLNRIEIIGYVGNIRIDNVGDRKVARLSVATNYVYRDKEGTPVIETTWHNCTAWEGKRIEDLTSIKKGDPVHVVGRLRVYRFTDADGNERIAYETFAYSLEKVSMEERLQAQDIAI